MFRYRSLWFPFLIALFSCTTASLPIPQSWLSTPAAQRMGPIELGSGGTVRTVPSLPRSTEDVRIEKRPDGDVLVRGSEALTPAFSAIQSFDLSMDRREVAFSAKRKDNFDVGLVSLDGSRINWVPEDPADETDPKWALRGNKFSYVLRTPAGDFVRTIHVPTSFQLTIAFPNSVVNALAWDAASERFAVSYESPEASERVDVMKYGGEERKSAVEPAVRLAYAIEPFGRDAVLMRPAELRYEEKLPVVVWLTEGRLNEWDDARAALLKGIRAACVITTRPPDPAMWERLAAIQWASRERLFVVNPTMAAVSAPSPAVIISGDADIPSGRYRREERSVLVAPAVVESFAVGFVADQLKGGSPLASR